MACPTDRRPLITVLTPCYNEKDNVDELCERLRAQFDRLPHIDFRHLLIDNASTDGTVARIEAQMALDSRVALIENVRNFGHIRSPMHALMQAEGDAVITMASDLQDPPECIGAFIEAWERGTPIIAAIKKTSEESGLMWWLRTAYYKWLRRMSSTELIEHFTGFGLYDRDVIEAVREIGDAYPYMRGLISELGFPLERVEFDQPLRKRGITKNNFYTLYDMGMLGITSHSKVPLRLAVMAGFVMSAVSLGISLVYLLLKLLFWDSFQMGTAPMLIGMFFLGSVQLLFIGLLGEYVGAIHTQVLRRPLVIEKRRRGLPAQSLPYGQAKP